MAAVRKPPGYERMATAVCTTHGKKLWKSRKHARVAMKRLFPGDHMSAYECGAHPGYWHIGHMPKMITQGDYDRRRM